jgi:hypothetical protein
MDGDGRAQERPVLVDGEDVCADRDLGVVAAITLLSR